MDTTVFIIGLTALIIGSITDIKKREVPDWLNFGLITTGILFSIILSVKFLNISIFISSLLGLVLSFTVAALMFYTGQWGGGDAKMLMGLGALFGIPLSLNNLTSSFFINFIFNMFIIGAFYGFLWIIGVSIFNIKNIIFELKKHKKDKRYAITKKIIFTLASISIFLSIINKDYRIIFAVYPIISIFLYYFFIFIRSVENSCMIKNIPVNRLTEGDWIQKDISIDGKKFLEKGHIITKKDIKRIIKHQNDIDKEVYIKRYFINKKIRISRLQKNDIILKQDPILKKLKIQDKLSEDDLIRINIYLRKNLFHKVEVTRKNLFFKAKKKIDPKTLKPKDILEQELRKDKYLIASSDDLGIENYQIEEIKKNKIKNITIKEGMPFIPSFLIAYIITYFSRPFIETLLKLFF